MAASSVRSTTCGGAVHLRGDLGDALVVAVEQVDLGAGLGEPRRDGRADAAGGARHEGPASGEGGRCDGRWRWSWPSP